MATLQDVLALHLDDYVRGRHLHPREARAAACILRCYTPAAGSHLDACPLGHFYSEVFHACHHRSCPRCADAPRQHWADAQLQRLLPCPHFHCVFTLPHELLPLWEFNRQTMISLLIDAVRSTLLRMLADPRHLGATPGLLLSLHTWGRNLSHHPHVHALVTAGGLRPDGSWLATRAGFLLPLPPLRKLFAGLLLAALTERLNNASLRLPASLPLPHWRELIGRLYRKHWNLQINAPYASGRSVTLYLARYAIGGPLPKDRDLHLHEGRVCFDYTDHREGRRKRLELSAHEFIDRILWHAPPKGVHTIRHAGLYATACREHHRRAVLALALPEPPSPHDIVFAPTPANPPAAPALCPLCGAALRSRFIPPARAADQISFVSSAPASGAPPATAHLGPTQRSNGHLTGKLGRAPPPDQYRLRPAELARQMPFN
jgi:Putative transposase/Transposase zinc-binding domain